MISPLFRREISTGLLRNEVAEHRWLAVKGSGVGVSPIRDLSLQYLSVRRPQELAVGRECIQTWL